jgi:hypothetical protein
VEQVTNVKYAKRCFVISPIGEKGSVVRKHADEVFKYIIAPAMEKCRIAPFRSDDLEEPGRISEQMFRAILDYDLCVAVLTGHNPNVFYELAVAQAAKRPVALLIEKSELLPFDIQDLRCIRYDQHTVEDHTPIEQLVKVVEAIKAANWKAPDMFVAFSKASAAQAAITSFCDRVKGEWWERISVDDHYELGYFQIKCEDLYNSVQLEGRVYNEEGALEAYWKSAATGVDTGDRKIIYVRKCWHPRNPDKEWYHGFGEMEFEDSENSNRGWGRFCDIDRTHPERAVVRPVSLRRVGGEKSTMRRDIENDVRPLIVKILSSFKVRSTCLL